MPRKYEVLACPVHGTEHMINGQCRALVEKTRTHWRYCHRQQPVTAIDARDVEPLTRAVQEAVTKLQGDRRNREPDAVALHMQRALKAFEDEEGSGG